MKAKSIVYTVLLVIAMCSAVLAQTEITLVGITNVTHDSVLAGGQSHVISLRYDLSGAPTDRNYLTANGWKIYSPDGADWLYVQGEALPVFSSLDWDHIYVSHFDKSGGSGSFGLPLVNGGGNTSGNDTVGVLLAGINSDPGGGLPGGFVDMVFNIEISSRREDAGLHICIDTCRQVPGGSWEWAQADGLIEPDWSGAVCWVVSCCAGHVGDVNGVGGDDPTIADISTLIDFLFISGDTPDCLDEADVNLSGTLVNPPLDWSDVTVSDASVLIDHLFIDKPELADCP